MRKFLAFAAVTTAAVTAAAPASAQHWHIQPHAQRQIAGDINQLDNKINRAIAKRTVSQREAVGLRRQANYLKQTYYRFTRNGLTRPEGAQLEAGVNQLHQRLRLERRDWDGRRG